MAVQFIFILFIVVSCEMDDITNTALTGNWEWERTDGGFAAHIHETPALTGKSVRLELRDDKKYFIYTNGQLTSKGTYSLSVKKCIHDHREKQLINFSFDQNLMIESIDSEQIYLSDEMYDGIGILYKRVTGSNSQKGE